MLEPESTSFQSENAIDGCGNAAICSVSRGAIELAANIAMLGSNRMKKIAFVLAAAGLMSVAACNDKTPAADNVIANAELVSDNLTATADNLVAVADNTTNGAAAAAIGNAADQLNAAASNVREAADAKVENLTK